MIEQMTIQRMDHVGIVVEDLAVAVTFFAELRLELEGKATVEGRSVDRVVWLEGVRSDITMMRTPDCHARLELTKFHTPPARGGDPGAPANALGIRSHRRVAALGTTRCGASGHPRPNSSVSTVSPESTQRYL